ncbi:hypothetical protein EZ437_07490 [Pedobacter psychroterrae]|uniref:T9SS C-terminal target domain-containing protein n=2 Tax=Pedobacter psychroterrae TaxID=2530453 RepID=A0A4V2MLY2_9SPHI|nr:hypothetical protein EZ437_07490 [Pedobacter psychroterrae]
MKNQLLITALSVLVFFASCSKDPSDEGTINPPPTENVVTVTGDITTATTWSADKIYLLKGNVYVTGNATLTIQAGTIIKGDKATKGSLVITRGAKIEAVGTVDKPIVFTSNQPVGAREKGDWGGLVLLGKAKNNVGTAVKIEGIADATDKALHGGTDDADNSGTLKYIRVEFAGIALGPDNEINGVTFGSVGSGTTVDYVQVYRSGDDAFEFFGGTVNAKHLISVGTWDDDFDTDFGYSGKVQFALAQRVATLADFSGSNGFESDNDGDGSDKAPQTSAVFSNVTVLGPYDVAGAGNINANYQHAAQIRRNSSISILNSILAGYSEGIYFDDTKVTTAGSTSTNFTAGRSVFANNLVLGSNAKSNQIKAGAGVLAALTTALNLNNTFTPASYASSVLTDAYKFAPDLVAAAKQGTPNFTVVAGSAAASGAVFTDAKVSATFFEKVAYRGAFGTTDWTSGWASYNPQVLAYTTPGAVK